MNMNSPSDPCQCAGGCGFFGNPATENMCSKCYRETESTRADQQARVTAAQEAQAGHQIADTISAATPAEITTTESTTPTIFNSPPSPVGPTRLSFGNVSISSPLTSPKNADASCDDAKQNAEGEAKGTAQDEKTMEVGSTTEESSVTPASTKDSKVQPELPATTPLATTAVAAPEVAKAEDTKEQKPKKKVQKNKKRCFHSECRKKVGLASIECKCGYIFCGLHRWPDQHNCDFDFKTHDRANLAKSLPGGGNFAKMQKLE